MTQSISYHSPSLVEETMQNDSNYFLNPFFMWMCTFVNDSTVSDNLLYIFHRYKVGMTSSGEVIYWQHDLQGNCRGGKLMKYDNTGHRLKNYGAKWMHSLMRQSDFNLSQVPFGLHLLPSHPQNCSVVVVESEKTALIAAAYHVLYINDQPRLPLFIATGGAGNLKNTLKYLKGRHVVIFPDEDQVIEWSKIASQYSSTFRSLSIDTTVRQMVIDGTLPPKSDYGDLLALKYGAFQMSIV